ncbi:MAG: hypothetical protein RL654_2169 [Pseudomonadota bacterium]|jgi:uncharacterized membrane protein
MMIRPISLPAHGLLVLLLGLMAGFFGTYTINVAPAMLTLDGATYAQVQSELNRNVRHATFFAGFFGPVPAGMLALLGSARQRPGWWWLLALVTLAYGLGIVLFTRQVNLPLNHLTESWTPATLPPDWAQVRDAWNRANAWRSALSLVLFAAGLASLAWRLSGARRDADGNAHGDER